MDTYRKRISQSKKKKAKKEVGQQSKVFVDEQMLLTDASHSKGGKERKSEAIKKKYSKRQSSGTLRARTSEKPKDRISVQKRTSEKPARIKPSTPTRTPGTAQRSVQQETIAEKTKLSSSSSHEQLSKKATESATHSTEKATFASPSTQKQSSAEKTKSTALSMEGQSVSPFQTQISEEKTKPVSPLQRPSSEEKTKPVSPSLRPSSEEKTKLVSPSTQRKSSPKEKKSVTPLTQRQTNEDIDRLTSPSLESQAVSRKTTSPSVEESQEIDKGSNNSALEGITARDCKARFSENNSNLAEWEITPRQVLSRIIDNSRILTLKRTSRPFRPGNATTSAKLESSLLSNKSSSNKDIRDQEVSR